MWTILGPKTATTFLFPAQLTGCGAATMCARCAGHKSGHAGAAATVALVAIGYLCGILAPLLGHIVALRACRAMLALTVRRS